MAKRIITPEREAKIRKGQERVQKTRDQHKSDKKK